MQPLSVECIRALYGSSLVYVAPSRAHDAKETQENRCCIADRSAGGENNKEAHKLSDYHVYVGIRAETLRDVAEKDLLLSILKACKIDTSKALLINYLHAPLSQEELGQMHHKVLLGFGLTASDFHLHIPLKEYIEYADVQKNIFVSSAPLATLKHNIEDKKKLWMSLQKIFNSI